MRKFKRLMSVLMSAVVAFSFCLVRDKGQVEAATAEEFLDSAFDKSYVTVYNGSDDLNTFQINGKTYKQGILLKTAQWSPIWYDSYNSKISFNVDNIDSITFTLGHIDNSNGGDSTLKIYKDYELFYEIDVQTNMTTKYYSMNTQNASTITFKLEDCEKYYAIADIVLNENYDSITDGSYSDKSKIKNIDLLIRKGDINNSGSIDLYDVIAVAKYMMGMITFNSEEMQLADYNEDSNVDLYDAIEMARLIMK